MANQDEVKIIFKQEGAEQTAQATDKVKDSIDGVNKVADKSPGAGAKIKGAFDSMNKAGASLVGMAAPAAAALGLMLKDWVDSAMEAQRTSTQLDSVLKSTAGAAGLTADEVKGMATALSRVTTLQDDTILSGQNMLLTFTNIGKDVFPQVTETMLDMSTAMNGGVTPSAEQLKGSAIQLGKALNDPTEGLTALTRVGVTFTEEQKKSIETMQKHGDIMGAQKVILAELGREFGGSARAQAATFEGQMTQLNNRVGELKEDLGRALIPILQELAKAVEFVVTWFENLDPKTKEAIAQGVLLGAALAAIVAAAGLLMLALNPVTIVIAGIVAAFILWKTKGEEITLSMEILAKSMETTWNEIKLSFAKGLAYIVDKMSQIPGVGDAFKGLAENAKHWTEELNKDVEKNYDELVDLTAKKTKMAREAAEDEIGRMKDNLSALQGEDLDNARKALDEKKAAYLKIYPEMRLGATSELVKMREDEEKEANARREMMLKKFMEQNADAIKWGRDFVANITTGMNSNKGLLQNAVTGLANIMSQVHQSYNPLLPAERWGKGFVANLQAGVISGAPLVSDALYKIEERFQGFKGDIKRITDFTAETAKLKLLSAQLKEISAAGTEQANAKQKEMDDLQKLWKKQDDAKQEAELRFAVGAAKTGDERVAAETALASFLMQQERDAQMEKLQGELDTINQTTQAQLEAKQKEIDTTTQIIEQKKAMYTQMTNALNALQEDMNRKAVFEYQKRNIEEQISQAKTNKEVQKLNEDLQKLISDEKLAQIKSTADEEMKAAQGVFDKESALVTAMIKQYGELQRAKIAALSASASSAPVSKRASGGPVIKGQPYLVGEYGPEPFIPNESGRILPTGSSVGGSKSVVNITLHFNGPVSNKEVAMEYADIILKELQLSTQVI